MEVLGPALQVACKDLQVLVWLPSSSKFWWPCLGSMLSHSLGSLSSVITLVEVLIIALVGILFLAGVRVSTHVAVVISQGHGAVVGVLVPVPGEIILPAAIHATVLAIHTRMDNSKQKSRRRTRIATIEYQLLWYKQLVSNFENVNKQMDRNKTEATRAT